MSVEIIPHSKKWAEEFRDLVATLRRIVGDTAIRIDHIGSTAVPLLCSKDRIDIQMTLASSDQFGVVEAQLEPNGFRRIRHVSCDHIPPDCSLDNSNWQKQLYGPPEGSRAMNLHVRIQGKANQRYPILFRDYLRADETTAELYGRVKQQLALHCNDSAAYCDVKDPVCDLIMQAAEKWASESGWTLPPGDA